MRPKETKRLGKRSESDPCVCVLSYIMYQMSPMLHTLMLCIKINWKAEKEKRTSALFIYAVVYATKTMIVYHFFSQLIAVHSAFCCFYYHSQKLCVFTTINAVGREENIKMFVRFVPFEMYRSKHCEGNENQFNSNKLFFRRHFLH